MKTKFAIDDKLLQKAVEKSYDILIHNIHFIPEGDISYAYQVSCKEGTKYFLKLFDKSTKKGREGVRRLKFYLPVTRDMFDGGLYQNIAYPVKNIRGKFSVDIGPAVIVLFNFIEGETLADAYPFSRELLEKVAAGIARIHGLTGSLHFKSASVEDFDVSFLDSLERDLDLLEQMDLPRLHTNRIDEADNNIDPSIRALCEYVLPRRDRIMEFSEKLYLYRDSIEVDPYEMVLTHGDIWGGNLMLDPQGELHFIDWESAMIAPREADLRHYLFEDFDFFMQKYREASRDTVRLDRDILGFYVYRSHLANLANWIARMLHNNQSLEQNASDYECVMFHCMERWDSVDEKMESLENTLL
jgi:spectinomycin phosphotransferase